MALHENTRVCTHIKVNGIRCGSPALREEVFCYFHQRMIRGVRTPPRSRLHPIAMLEDEASIQASLMEIINALVRNHIDVNRARLILRALYIATKNAEKTRFGWFKDTMVSEVPEYPAAPPAAGPFTEARIQAEALTQINVPQESPAAQAARNRRIRDEFFASAYPAPKPPASARKGRGRPALRTRAG